MKIRFDLLALEYAAALTVPAGFLLAWLTLQRDLPACIEIDPSLCRASRFGSAVIASIIIVIALLSGAGIVRMACLKRQDSRNLSSQIGYTFGQAASAVPVLLQAIMLARIGGVFGASVPLHTLLLFDSATLLTMGAFVGRVPSKNALWMQNRWTLARRLAADRAKRLLGKLLAATGLVTALAVALSTMFAVGVMCCGVVMTLSLSLREGWRVRHAGAEGG